MLRPITATNKRPRRPKRKEVSRSFRISLEIDRALDAEAVRKGWTKSFLIRDIIRGWFTYRQAREKVEIEAHAGD